MGKGVCCEKQILGLRIKAEEDVARIEVKSLRESRAPRVGEMSIAVAGTQRRRGAKECVCRQEKTGK
jgi:hypothetical protein